jgi:uncharacterized protein (DUF736 family)
MLTVEQLESVCESSQMPKLPKHEIEPPELLLEETFNPYGFPAVVTTNSDCVLDQFREMWERFKRQHNTEPIRIDVQLVPSDSAECPPEPSYRIMMPQIMAVADAHNYTVVDLDRCHANLVISDAAIRHPSYAQYFLLGMPVCCIATSLATPIHAGCVTLDGRGVLLCGDSGAGKSTLSFACARQGWTFVSDDAVYLLNGGTERMVTGDCYKIRFRPAASEFFPEVRGLELTPRATGKPSIELPTHALPHIACSQNAHVDFIVFLNRRTGSQQELVSYRKDVARQFMRQTLYGSPITRASQYAAIERLLATEVFELRYTDIDWAVHRLRTLVERGR